MGALSKLTDVFGTAESHARVALRAGSFDFPFAVLRASAKQGGQPRAAVPTWAVLIPDKRQMRKRPFGALLLAIARAPIGPPRSIARQKTPRSRMTIHSDQLSVRLKPSPDTELESAPEATAKERNETWVTTGVLEA